MFQLENRRVILFLLGVLLLLIWFWPWFDYFDLGIWEGVNIFHLNRDLEAVVTWFVGVPVIATFVVTVLTFQEQQRQNELKLRPYLRLAWESSYIGENRRAQGITDSCLIAVNEGNGHMRNVEYHAAVNSTPVALRRHEFISSGSPTIIVYDDLNNKAGPALGDRNDPNQVAENHRIIREDIVVVWGTYTDRTGKAKYQFRFTSDPQSQSNFSEPEMQRRIS